MNELEDSVDHLTDSVDHGKDSVDRPLGILLTFDEEKICTASRPHRLAIIYFT